MPEAKLCTCPQCGKKYKLKPEFNAASFSCKACSATVWVEGKPPAPASKRGGGGGGRRRAGATRSRGRGRAAGKAAPARRGRQREEVEDAHEGRRGYERPKSNANLYLAIGGLVVIGGVVAFVVMSGKKDPPAPPMASGTGASQPAAGTAPTPAPTPETPAVNATPETGDLANAGGESEETPGEASSTTKPVATALAEGDNTENPAAPTGVKKSLGATNKQKRPKGTSRWDPPATLGHLKSTSAEHRKMIDELVALMFDAQAGRDSLDAKQKLSAIGKPAFPVILGKMAQVRDTITDVDSLDERLIESSLKLADICLREMDGYLTSKEKAPIRPGTDKKYVTYILRLHYRRWKETLEAMDEMPGPYDPSIEYKEEEK